MRDGLLKRDGDEFEGNSVDILCANVSESMFKDEDFLGDIIEWVPDTDEILNGDTALKEVNIDQQLVCAIHKLLNRDERVIERSQDDPAYGRIQEETAHGKVHIEPAYEMIQEEIAC